MQCKMTKRYLTEHDVAFVEHNINENPEYINYLKAQGFQAVPVIEIEGQAAFSGFRPEQLQAVAG